ncbi:MAG: amino acid-binding protein [Bacteroidota bacterium]|nr:amino acid-binding protein [Bacteroidota bacterium]MDP4204712.1 amino acid-binding protein [Bacteroidota bacterium]
MKVKQLSVFLENREGRLMEVTKILGKSGVNMSAYFVADTSEFGILRVIVSDPEKAFNVLREAGFTVRLSDVVCLSCPNHPGALSLALEILAREEIFIEYMYAFSSGESANVILRPTDVDRCIDVLQKNQMELVSASELYKF